MSLRKVTKYTRIALELGYPEECRIRIADAASENEVSRILREYRIAAARTAEEGDNE